MSNHKKTYALVGGETRVRHPGPWLLACVIVVGVIVLDITGHEDALYHIADAVGILLGFVVAVIILLVF